MGQIENMIIKLNNRFYRKEAIEEAIDDFKTVCDGKIISDEIEVDLDPKENVKNLRGEFCNYVFGLMKNRKII